MINTSTIVENLKKYDYTYFFIGFVIFIVGIFNLYSATHSSPNMSSLYKTQLLYFFISLVVGAGISFFNTKFFYRYSYLFYLLNIILLVLVLIMGEKGMGARRWLSLGFMRIQPSELMKISVILAVSRWYAKSEPDRELGIKETIIPAILALIPTGLIVAEPDLGTGILICLIFGVLAFYRKLKWRSIFILAILGMLSGAVMYKFGLKDYQRKRISTFLNPGEDARGSGYNAIQSKIAIGSGEFMGKGWKKSSQASLNYLPENHTDFVFSIFNEEHGFLGGLFLIALYLVLFARLIWLATSVNRVFDSIVVMGVTAVFFWHTFINMAMVTGLLPIVGLPLPLMSYGGSSLMTFCLCLGIATSISNSRNFF